MSNICKFSSNFWRARSRLYQNEILQENMRLTAFFKLYKIFILLHRCNLKILAKNLFEKSAIFVKIRQFFFQMLQNLQNFAEFQRCQLDNLVDSEKMLKNEYLLAKIDYDIAENEPAKNLQNKFNKMQNFLILPF